MSGSVSKIVFLSLFGTVFIFLSTPSIAKAALSEDNAAWYKVIALYENVLDRTVAEVNADMAGVNYWTSQVLAGMSLDDLERNLKNSDEYFVRQLYKSELGRSGDSSGIQNWTNALSRGLSRSELQNQFRSICANHVNGECRDKVVEAPVQAPAPAPAYTCSLSPGPEYNCIRFDRYSTTGIYTCSNGAQVAILSTLTCANSYTLPFAPVNHQTYQYKPGIGVQPK